MDAHILTKPVKPLLQSLFVSAFDEHIAQESCDPQVCVKEMVTLE